MAVTDPANQIEMLKQILNLKMCATAHYCAFTGRLLGETSCKSSQRVPLKTITIKSFQVLLSVHGYVPITQTHSSSVRILEDPRASCTRGIREAKKFKQPQQKLHAHKDSVKMYREQT